MVSKDLMTIEKILAQKRPQGNTPNSYTVIEPGRDAQAYYGATLYPIPYSLFITLVVQEGYQIIKLKNHVE